MSSKSPGETRPSSRAPKPSNKSASGKSSETQEQPPEPMTPAPMPWKLALSFMVILGLLAAYGILGAH